MDIQFLIWIWPQRHRYKKQCTFYFCRWLQTWICCVRLHHPVDDDDNLTNYYSRKKVERNRVKTVSVSVSLDAVLQTSVLWKENTRFGWFFSWPASWLVERYAVLLHHIVASTVCGWSAQYITATVFEFCWTSNSRFNGRFFFSPGFVLIKWKLHFRY